MQACIYSPRHRAVSALDVRDLLGAKGLFCSVPFRVVQLELQCYVSRLPASSNAL